MYSDSLLTPTVISRLFSKVSSQDLYPPIYIANDDVLFIEKIKYYPPQQLSINDSEDAIRALLTTQAKIEKTNKVARKN